MLSFLFWNLMGNRSATWNDRASGLRVSIGRMARTLDVDFFLFAESAFETADLTEALNSTGAGAFCRPASNSKRIQLYTRLPADSVADQFNDSADGRLTIRRVTAPSGPELLLAVVHFQSRLAWTREAQALQATVLPKDVAAAEDVVGHRRTVLVGDLNMNPYDLGMIGAQGLNAAMTRDLARAEDREVVGHKYRFFYNPMWGFFGDRTPGPAGSYFYGAGSPDTPYWHVFDQVLLRPALADSLTELRILDNDGQEPLVSNRGRPRDGDLTDHLPVLFRLDI